MTHTLPPRTINKPVDDYNRFLESMASRLSPPTPLTLCFPNLTRDAENLLSLRSNPVLAILLG